VSSKTLACPKQGLDIVVQLCGDDGGAGKCADLAQPCLEYSCAPSNLPFYACQLSPVPLGCTQVGGSSSGSGSSTGGGSSSTSSRSSSGGSSSSSESSGSASGSGGATPCETQGQCGDAGRACCSTTDASAGECVPGEGSEHSCGGSYPIKHCGAPGECSNLEVCCVASGESFGTCTTATGCLAHSSDYARCVPSEGQCGAGGSCQIEQCPVNGGTATLTVCGISGTMTGPCTAPAVCGGGENAMPCPVEEPACCPATKDGGAPMCASNCGIMIQN
jgi:hypothetical protein